MNKTGQWKAFWNYHDTGRQVYPDLYNAGYLKLYMNGNKAFEFISIEEFGERLSKGAFSRRGQVRMEGNNRSIRGSLQKGFATEAIIDLWRKSGGLCETGNLPNQPRNDAQAALWALQGKLETGIPSEPGRKRPDLENGWVYAISIPSYPGLLKIGYTGDLDKRKSTLQVAVPEEIKIEFSKPVIRPRAVEDMAHFKTQELHVRGEWFELDLASAKAVIELASSEVTKANSIVEHSRK